jgi:rare lipoprotein A
MLLLSGCLVVAASQPVQADPSDHQAKKTQKQAQQKKHKRAARIDPKKKHEPDLSGKPRRGEASYYARSFAGKTMADGTPMNPNADIAASRTLPLGTKAKVTNLENGKSSVVEIRDRGPYVDGRIVDLSPKVAKKLDMIEDGVAPVVVTPLELPGEETVPQQASIPGENTSGE